MIVVIGKEIETIIIIKKKLKINLLIKCSVK